MAVSVTAAASLGAPLSLLVLASAAFAQGKEEPTFPVVKLSGMLFPSYSLDLSDGADLANAFDVDRVYLRTDVTMSKRFAARVTLDADHMKPALLSSGEEVTYDTKYRVFVKHAYLEARDLGPIKVRIGMIDTPYTPFYDALWGHRYVAESFAKNAGVLETADLGVAILGNHGGGLVDWNVEVLNGEGYNKLEVDAGKSFHGRLTVNPLAKMEKRALPITGFAAYAMHPSTGEDTFTWAGSVGFDMPRLFVWAEVLGTSTGPTSGLGYSATLNPRLPKYAGLIARYDHWDPDTDAGDDGENLLIAGIDRDFMDKVSLALTYEREWVDGAADAATHGIVLHGQAGF